MILILLLFVFDYVVPLEGRFHSIPGRKQLLITVLPLFLRYHANTFRVQISACTKFR